MLQSNTNEILFLHIKIRHGRTSVRTGGEVGATGAGAGAADLAKSTSKPNLTQRLRRKQVFLGELQA